MSTLEQQYRKALRWYSEAWRLRNEDAVIGTLLDAAEGDNRSTPGRLELANLAIHGVASRCRELPSAVPSNVRDRASTASLAIGAAIALSAAVSLEVPPESSQLYGFTFQTLGSFSSPAIVIYALWIVAFFSAMAGFATASRVVTLAMVPLSFVVRVWADAQGLTLRPTWSFMGLLVLLAVLVSAGRPSSTRSATRWLVAWFLPAFLVFTLPAALDSGPPWLQEPLWLARPYVIAWSPVIAIAVAVTVALSGRVQWATAILLIGIPFSAVALTSGTGVMLETAQLSLLIALGIIGVVALLRIFGLRIRLERGTRP